MGVVAVWCGALCLAGAGLVASVTALQSPDYALRCALDYLIFAVYSFFAIRARMWASVHQVIRFLAAFDVCVAMIRIGIVRPFTPPGLTSYVSMVICASSVVVLATLALGSDGERKA